MMEFIDEKYEQMNHGMIKKRTETSYVGPTRKDIDFEENVKDLGIIWNEKL